MKRSLDSIWVFDFSSVLEMSPTSRYWTCLSIIRQCWQVTTSQEVHPQLTLSYFRALLPVGGVRVHDVSCRTVLVRFSGSGAADKWTVRSCSVLCASRRRFILGRGSWGVVSMETPLIATRPLKPDAGGRPPRESCFPAPPPPSRPPDTDTHTHTYTH